MIREEDLKPCPFCGGEEIDVQRIYINPLRPNALPDEVCVTCISCGLGGYTEEEAQDAFEAWNHRIPTEGSE